MSDLVLAACVTTIPGTISAILGFVNNRLAQRHSRAIKTLSDQTNGMKDELVRVSDNAAFDQGVIVGEGHATTAELSRRTE
jgi:hypothetical protein